MREKDEPAPEKAGGPGRQGTAMRRGTAGGALGWRRLLTGAVLAGGAFAVLFLLATSVPALGFLIALVFLPVGLWVGRGSRRPLLDGLIYGLLSAVAAEVVMLPSGFPRGLALAFPFLLAVPQGVLGTWLGKRFLCPRGARKGSP